MSERTFRRWTRRYEEDGEAGLADRRLGKVSGRPVPADRRWSGFIASAIRASRSSIPRASGEGSWLRLGLHLAEAASAVGGAGAQGAAQGAHQGKRERRPLPGMMLHQDGSRHDWLGGQPALDLIVTLNDATGTIDSAFLAGEEGTASTCRAEGGLLRARPANSLYTDRGAHYFHTPKAGGQIDRVIRPRSAGRSSN